MAVRTESPDPARRRVLGGMLAAGSVLLPGVSRAGRDTSMAAPDASRAVADAEASAADPPAWVVRPRSQSELVQALRHGARPVRPVGAAQSESALHATPGTHLDLRGLEGVVGWNDALQRVRVRAGTSLAALGESLATNGWALPVTGDDDACSIAGACATAMHGAAARHTALSGAVTALQLMTVKGDLLEVSERENPELRPALACSLGVLGVVTEIELAVVPLQHLREEYTRVDADDAIRQFPSIIERNRHAELWLFSHGDTGILRCLNPGTAATEPHARGAGGLRRRAQQLMMQLGQSVPPLEGMLQPVLPWLLMPPVRVDYSHRLLPRPAAVPYRALEYALPLRRADDAIDELRALLRREEARLMLPMVLRPVAEDDGWISPFYRQASITIRLAQGQGRPHEALFTRAEAILARHGGRPHWGLWHRQDARTLADMYPRWDDFRRLRARLDPQKRLLTAPLQQLLGA